MLVKENEMDYRKITENVNKFAAKYEHIKAVYLYGSVCTGRSGPKSDVDVAIISNKEISGWERIDLETELSNMIGADTDLTVFHQVGPLLQHQILKNGKLVYESDIQERIRQETFARYEYLDTRHLHNELGELING